MTTASPPGTGIPGAPSTPAAPRPAWRLAFAYDARADRLGLSVGTGGGAGAQVVSLALTRRLTARLVDGFAQLLERTSAAAAAAPSDMREDIILLEHQSALVAAESAGRRPDQAASAAPGGAAPATGVAAGAPGEAGAVAPPPLMANPSLIAALPLLDAIDVAVTKADFGLTLKAHPPAVPGGAPQESAQPGGGSQAVVAFRATRAELHLVLEALARNAARAGWNLEPESGWLGKRHHMPEGQTVTLN